MHLTLRCGAFAHYPLTPPAGVMVSQVIYNVPMYVLTFCAADHFDCSTTCNLTPHALAVRFCGLTDALCTLRGHLAGYLGMKWKGSTNGAS